MTTSEWPDTKRGLLAVIPGSHYRLPQGYDKIQNRGTPRHCDRTGVQQNEQRKEEVRHRGNPGHAQLHPETIAERRHTGDQRGRLDAGDVTCATIPTKIITSFKVYRNPKLYSGMTY